MCFLLMKMFGTVDWPVMVARADWISAPSSMRWPSQYGIVLNEKWKRATHQLDPVQWRRTSRRNPSEVSLMHGSRGNKIC
jgi:hypothetical protein